MKHECNGLTLKDKENIHVISSFGLVKAAKQVLTKSPTLIDQCVLESNTPLILAVRMGHADFVLALLEYDVDVDTILLQDGKEITPLSLAIDLGHRDIIGDLTRYGAKVTKTAVIQALSQDLKTGGGLTNLSKSILYLLLQNILFNSRNSYTLDQFILEIFARQYNPRMMKHILDERTYHLDYTRILEAGAMNAKYGKLIVGLLINQKNTGSAKMVEVTERMVENAASNLKHGAAIIVLLARHSNEVLPVTYRFFKKVSKNDKGGEFIIEALLRQRGKS